MLSRHARDALPLDTQCNALQYRYISNTRQTKENTMNYILCIRYLMAKDALTLVEAIREYARIQKAA